MRRRDVLVGAGRGMIGLALIAATASVTASGCARDGTPEVDPLQVPLDQALSDAELARSAAEALPAAPGGLRAALTQIATERTEHAEALAEEIGRARREPPPTTTSTAADPSEPATPAPPPSSSDVAKALTSSAEAAAALAAEQSGYRAGLLGSIAAACTASATVTLPAPKAKS